MNFRICGEQHMNRQHKITLFIIGILLALSLFLSISYAFYLFAISQEGSNVVKTDCFEITFSDGNAINLSSSIPLTDDEANDLTPYSFTIKNICNNTMRYDINIETLNNTTMDLSAIAVKLNNYQKKILNTLNNNDSIINTNASSSKTIYSSVLNNGEERTFNLKIWLDENATIEQSANKIYSSKVVISTSLDN